MTTTIMLQSGAFSDTTRLLFARCHPKILSNSNASPLPAAYPNPTIRITTIRRRRSNSSNVVSPKAVSDSSYSQTCLGPDASHSVLGIIIGGGAGTRLYPLTKKRANPAVPLGGNYRLIDIPVSNCLNSNISKIYVLTQFNSASLNRHLSRAYSSNMGGYKNEGFVEVLAAQQSPENPDCFQILVIMYLRFYMEELFDIGNLHGLHNDDHSIVPRIYIAKK